MPLSQNGYTANNRSVIRSEIIPGTDVRVAVRRGAAGDLLLYAAARWHREVEPLRAADGVLDCWGYAERTIRGSSTTLSNHASGTALDLRARIHPLGRVGTYGPEQVAAIHRILADCRGAIRWGGDYTGRKDEMHIEVIVSEAACAHVLAQLPTIDHPNQQEDADMTPEESARLARLERGLELVLQQLVGPGATISDPFPGVARGGGWETWRYGQNGARRFTLVDYLRAIDRELCSPFDLANRPAHPGMPDTPVGQLLSTRAALLQLDALVRALAPAAGQ